jgi:hypothetical protein
VRECPLKCAKVRECPLTCAKVRECPLKCAKVRELSLLRLKGLKPSFYCCSLVYRVLLYRTFPISSRINIVFCPAG